MKPAANPVKVSGTTTGEDIRMSIASENMSHVAGILTNMYADRIAAVIREYATNARDAHIEAGYPGPVEVITPTKLRPTLSIRDYGAGLSREQVRNVYSQYGSSTKRDSDLVNGMLGIGSKSGLSYAESFTVVSIQDGQRLTVLVFRGDDGAPVMRVLDEQPTDDASGVEIQIPCRMGDATEFQIKAAHLFRYWERGTVVLNDKEPEPITESAYRLTDGIYIVDADDDAGFTSDVAVMAGVPYPTDFDAVPKRQQYDWRTSTKREVSDRYVIAWVDTGSVTFAPSREALMDTELTKRTINEVRDDFTEAVTDAIQRDVDAAATRQGAMEAYARAKLAINLGDRTPKATYAGDEVPTLIRYPDNPDGGRTSIWTVPARQSGAANRHGSPLGVEVAMLEHTIWVVNFTPSKFSKQQRERLEAYRNHASLSDDYHWALVANAEVPMPEWVENAIIWDWNEVRKWRDPNAPKGGTGRSLAGTYPVTKPDGGWRDNMKAADLPDTGLFYNHGGRYGGGYYERQWLQDTYPNGGWVYVGLTANRVDKFKRDFPHASTVEDAQEAVALAAWDKVPERELQLRAWTGGDWDEPEILFDLAGEVHDPELRDQIGRMKAVEKLKHRPELDPEYAVAPATPLPDHTEALKDRYPLFKNLMGRPDPKQVLLYVNAAFAARVKGST